MDALEVKNVSVCADHRDIVHDVSLTIPSGEVSVLMGPNGSGKSTLVNALMGHPHYTVSSGLLLLNGVNILADAPHEKARKGFFLSLQHIPRLGGVTLATFLHKVHGAQTGESADVLEYYLALRERAKEYGVTDTLLDRPLTDSLSGGEKKLSEVLQLIALRPHFAMLDEIDSGVDVDAMSVVFRVIRQLATEGTGFLVISHHPSLLEHLEPAQVHLMTGGRVVRSGDRALAEEVHRNGFCKAIECPMEETCDITKHHKK